jgi:uncharacterized RDD family membrane protein YckC
MLAFLIDGTVISTLTGLIAWIVRADIGMVVNVIMALAYSSVTAAYAVYMHGRFGQTLGKFIARVRVTRRDGSRLSYRQAAVRDFLPCLLVPVSMWYALNQVITGELPDLSLYNSVSSLALAWVFLELLTMLLNNERRAIHDFIADTVVVRVS